MCQTPKTSEAWLVGMPSRARAVTRAETFSSKSSSEGSPLLDLGKKERHGRYAPSRTVITVYGSVIPRCIIRSTLAATEGAIMKWGAQRFPDDAFFSQWRHFTEGGAWYHPYSLHIFGMMLGFALVMRIQIAYQRYWEGTTQCHLASAKWADAVMQVMAFDEASKDAFSDAALEFRSLIMHYTSLMNATALIDIRRDDELNIDELPLNREDPYLFRPNANAALVDGSQGARSTGADGSGAGEPSVNKRQTAQSHRMNTVPLQLLLRTRANLQSKLDTQITSFEALEANERAVFVPQSYACGAACGCDGRQKTGGHRRSLFNPNAERGVGAGMLDAQDVSRAKLKKGELGWWNYWTTTICLTGNKQILQALASANKFEVVGGVSEAEIEYLTPLPPGDRAFIVQTWIVRLMTNRLAAGGLAIPPPLLSRTYQVLSDGTAAAMQARKVSYVAFPFPLRQLLTILLFVFTLIVPMCISAFMRSTAIVAVLCFFVILGYTALNETACELEHPFGLGANHLYLTAYQRQFNSKLARLLDQTIPQLGYAPPHDPRASRARANMEAAQRMAAAERATPPPAIPEDSGSTLTA